MGLCAGRSNELALFSIQHSSMPEKVKVFGKQYFHIPRKIFCGMTVCSTYYLLRNDSVSCYLKPIKEYGLLITLDLTKE